jgi:thymidylate synthase (FAD)
MHNGVRREAPVRVNSIKVLDKGYVRLISTTGSDLDVVNAARVSFDKESHEFNEADERLIKYLARNRESSPFRHSNLTFEVYAPLMVARQHWKYAIGSAHIEDGTAWNESSRRYITENNEFYLPAGDEWRSAPENMKQGSGDLLPDTSGTQFTYDLERYQENGQRLYARALSAGVAPEQARLFLPAYGLYVRYRWTPSLASVIHFLEERLGAGAQHEITAYAEAVFNLTYKVYPHSIAAWIGDDT